MWNVLNALHTSTEKNAQVGMHPFNKFKTHWLKMF